MIATNERRSSPVGFLILVFLATIGLFVGYIQLNRHAVERHGMDAVAVDQCFDNNGVLFEMTRPDDQTKMQACRDPNKPTIFYILIVCAVTGTCVTAFIFKKGRTSDRGQVENYFKNNGYKRNH